jgi:hypothetical protein
VSIAVFLGAAPRFQGADAGAKQGFKEQKMPVAL